MVALVAFRVALPGLVRDHVNRILDRDPDYDGSVGDIDLCLLCGRYTIHDVDVRDTTGNAPVPLFSAPAVQLSIAWDALFRGSVVGEIEVVRPRLNLVDSPAPGEDQDPGDADWREVVLDLFPVRIDRLAVTDGELHYANFSSEPEVDVYITNLDLVARNLTNSEDISESLVADLWATGEPMGYGSFVAVAVIDPFADLPTFDLDLELRDLELPKINDFLRAYGDFDAEAGELDVYVEVAANDGRFEGYVKPVLHRARVFRLGKEIEEDREGPLRLAWEGVVGAVKGIFTNEPAERQLAARVPIRGTFDDPEVRPWPAVASAIYNAFVEALFNGLDQDITWQDAPGRQG